MMNRDSACTHGTGLAIESLQVCQAFCTGQIRLTYTRQQRHTPEEGRHVLGGATQPRDPGLRKREQDMDTWPSGYLASWEGASSVSEEAPGHLGGSMAQGKVIGVAQVGETSV